MGLGVIPVRSISTEPGGGVRKCQKDGEPSGSNQRRDNAYGELVIVRMAGGQDPDGLAIECELTDQAPRPEIQLLAYISQIREMRFLPVSSPQHHPYSPQVQPAGVAVQIIGRGTPSRWGFPVFVVEISDLPTARVQIIRVQI